MATVHLDRVFLNLAADPTQYVTVRRLGGSQGGRSATTNGEVRNYANGRQRAVLGSGTPATVPLTFRTKDPTLLATVTSWSGQEIYYRDARGRRERCVFFEVPETDVAPDLTEISLTLTRVTDDAAPV